MGLEVYKIWARMFLKAIIKNEYYVMVAINFSDMEVKPANRHFFGVLVDKVFQILKEENAGVNIGCRIDDLIRHTLPELYRKVYI